jgi:microcystin-dependent protein
VYNTGTTNFASIYSNLAQTTPTANPVIADADGFLASFYWTGTIDVVLTDENNNIIDSANGIQDLVSTINAVVVSGNITLPFGTAAGDGDTITTTLPITSDFSDGGVFVVRANAANSGASNTPNLQVNSYASRRIKKIGGVALIANDIVSGMNMILVYNEAQDCYYLINHEATFLKRDGTAKMLGAIDMDSHKINNLTAGTAAGDAVRLDQLPEAATTSVLGLVTLAQVELAVASGIVTAYAGATVPTNWLECNGAAISRTTYAALFAAIGVLWGVGDGSTTFNLPDMRGEFLRGYDHGRGVDSGRALASSQTDDIKAHTHEVTGYAGVNLLTERINAGVIPGESGHSTGYTGGTETRPRNVSMMYIIKT